MNVSVSLDGTQYQVKPDKIEMAKISIRIAKRPVNLPLEELASYVGNYGCSFCPAVFNNGERKSDAFSEMQIFALDFDSKVTFEMIRTRAEKYDLPIAFAYHTFSSTELSERFRVVFIHECPVNNAIAAKVILALLHEVFLDADGQCKDVSRIFLGGKGLIYFHEETFNIASLGLQYQKYEYITNYSNYSRKIKGFAKKNKVALNGSYLEIGRALQLGRIEDFSEKPIYIIIGNDVKSSFFIKMASYQTDKRDNKVLNDQIRVKWSENGKKCALYKDFLNGVELEHNEKFLLLTNFVNIRGGRSKFLSYIEKRGDNLKDWSFYFGYAKSMGYKPQLCENGCKYCNYCNHKANMLLTIAEREKIQRLDDSKGYVSVENVYAHIESCLKDAMSEIRDGLYLIPAQTAAGKTKAYCDLVQSLKNEKIIIAVPTNLLKQQVVEELHIRGINAVVTPSIDEMKVPEELVNEVKYYYDIGINRMAAKVLRKFIIDHEEERNPEIIMAVQKCKEYLSFYSNIKRFEYIVTTHARLLTLSDDDLKGYTVIIDEDILLYLFKNIKKVSLRTIEKVLCLDHCPLALKALLSQIKGTKDNTYKTVTPMSEEAIISEDDLYQYGISENVNDLVQASVYYKEKNGDIQYFCPKMLPKAKYIILSASLSPELYRQYFCGWYVKEYSKKEAYYLGRLIQYSAHSMSRKDIFKRGDKAMDSIKDICGDIPIITFSKMGKGFNEYELHFGNTEGINALTGKDIAVVGTPHYAETVYKLIAFHLGIDVSDALHWQIIKYRGYKFGFTTYNNPMLREIQLYFIKSELEQSIGRARLLRFPSTVYLFSDFPCEQAELVQEEYIKEIEQ
ncbi:hypothetical protein FYJ38_22080 [Clostridium sp. WB02_MRS01]|uniref:hypothetical protein n=1 Tax=Clostridium sp. WB02_MRS01 TaxID=2605777 RepID=UPI0012B3011A|nr:hypothetical protein [Clostridium sp. WB02_MRS01]MSS11310.1 hypothetical protein [Clostridium sp. WB02_MRS01]